MTQIVDEGGAPVAPKRSQVRVHGGLTVWRDQEGFQWRARPAMSAEVAWQEAKDYRDDLLRRVAELNDVLGEGA